MIIYFDIDYLYIMSEMQNIYGIFLKGTRDINGSNISSEEDIQIKIREIL
jgi:hypothetical protein